MSVELCVYTSIKTTNIFDESYKIVAMQKYIIPIESKFSKLHFGC